MVRMIAGACVVAMLGAMSASAAPVTTMPANLKAVAELRAQNEALRERMARLELDLLVDDVLAGRGVKAPPVRHAALRPQMVALRK